MNSQLGNNISGLTAGGGTSYKIQGTSSSGGGTSYQVQGTSFSGEGRVNSGGETIADKNG